MANSENKKMKIKVKKATGEVVYVKHDNDDDASSDKDVKRLTSQGAKIFTTKWFFHSIITQYLSEIEDVPVGAEDQRLARRLRDKEIAEELSVSPATVNQHLKHLYRALDVRSRREAVARAVALGILHPTKPD